MKINPSEKKDLDAHEIFCSLLLYAHAHAHFDFLKFQVDLI